jgi:hypothetical protein
MLKYDTRVFPEVFGKQFNTSLNPNIELVTISHLINHTVGAWPTTDRFLDPMHRYSGLSHKILI